MTTISSLPRVSSLSDQTLFLVTENGVAKVVTWSYIRTTSTGYVGSSGIQGLQGNLGFVGSRGAGFAGSQGPQGPRGPAGGFTGSQGLGYSGSEGAGFTGSGGFGFVGSRGPAGPAGGYTGSSGVNGYMGSPGVPGSPGGFTGSAGIGTAGYVGSKGLKGESSFVYSTTAPTSPLPGDRWFDSNTGRELVYVSDIASSQWVEVAGGRVGFIGSQGAPGIPGGYTGSRGATGFGGLGYTGSNGGGFTGSSGAFAAMGYSGSAGTSGQLGFTGSTGGGFTGSGGQGFTGSGAGFTGSTGYVSSRGFTGSSGSGFTGSQGSQGSLGFTGSIGSGFIGSQGAQGTTGFVGSRGTIGFFGSKGNDGYYGSIGAIGYTGSFGIIGSRGYTGSSAITAYVYNVKSYGARGNGTSDDTTAINSAVSAALASSGGTIFFPAGVYKISSPIVITVPTGADPIKVVSFLGEGSAASYIYQSVADNGITFDTADGTLFGAYVSVKSLGIVGTNKTGSGLSFREVAYSEVDDVSIKGFDTGLYAANFLSSHIQRATLTFNTNGFRFDKFSAASPSSNPNAITMIACTAGNNDNYGGWVNGAGTFNFIGGSVEGNGAGTDLSVSKWGLRLTDCGGVLSQEAACAFALHGVYFEGNGGRAQFWVEQTVNRTGVTGVLTGCSFNSIGGTTASAWVYVAASQASYAFPITFNGCGWWGSSAYSPNVNYKTINNVGNNWPILLNGCNFYSTVDKYTVPVPSTTNSVGVPGMVTSDNSYMYICAADNKWYRYALATF